jgi:cation:H+ antiporter
MEASLHIVWVLGTLFAIVFSCIVFTNAIEHLGEKLCLSQGAVGSVLAAVGTALPETIVPLVAIIGAHLSGQDGVGHEIGIGAILGAPFMLGTLAFFVTGAAVFCFTWSKRRSLDMPINTSLMFRDLKYFALGYFIAIMGSFLPNPLLKHLLAVFLIAFYGFYVHRTIQDQSSVEVDSADELDPLYLGKCCVVAPKNEIILVYLQVLLSLAGIIVFADIFVKQLEFFSQLLGVNPMILSLIIAPIATELPEKFNSVIWIRAKKDTLALGNITGAMVFQSCIPTAVGLSLTPWVLGMDGLINVLIVYLSVLVVYLNIARNKGVLSPYSLLAGGAFYLIYLIYVLLKIKGIIL